MNECEGTQFVTSDAGNDNSDTFMTKIFCLNCKQYTEVTLPKGSKIGRVTGTEVTPRYTLPDGSEGVIVCGNCGVY